MANREHQTIVAVSSAPGRSRRGLVRVSGPGTLSILGRLVGANDVASLRPRQLWRVRLHGLSPTPLAGLVLFFAGPSSYTGEDLAEVQLPGNPALLERLVRAVVHLGASHAEPGEFTFRAYLAGKLDLTQAEGISATIGAVSDSQLAAAGMLREGRLGQFAHELVDELGDVLALTEAGIDFIDQEDVTPISHESLDQRLGEVEARLSRIIDQSRSWGAIEALPRVVLVGPPSSGKSTLFNRLLGTERAVVDPTANTTRDVLAQPMTLNDEAGGRIELMLVDMAGLDQPSAALDRQAQAVAREAIDQADLLIIFEDQGGEVISEPIAGKPTIRIQAKADLDLDQEGNFARGHDVARTDQGSASRPPLAVSAVSGENLDQLQVRIVRGLAQRSVSLQADMLALQPRHESALSQALEHVREARANLADQLPPELLGTAVRAALDELESLGGRLSPDQVIGRVFANFCVGK